MRSATSRRLLGGLLVVTFLFALPGPLSAAPEQAASLPAAQAAVAVVGAGALNVRSGPGVNHGIVAVIYQGQSVTVLGRHATNGWIKLRLFSGQEGWVNASYMFVSVPVSSLPVLEGVVVVPGAPSAVVATGALNVRAGPDVSYAVLTVVRQGEYVALLGRNSAASWVKVQTSTGVQGWVNASLIIADVSIQTLPVVSDVVVVPTVAIVISGAANIRTGPGTEYGVTTVVYQGAALTLLGRNAGSTWVHVRTTLGVTGWVSASVIQASVPISSLPVVEVSAPSNTAVVATGALNVRYGPGIGFGAFAVLYQGQTVVLLGRASYGTWVQVRTPSGAVGWVNANYLQSNIPWHTLPVV